jgi:hypothetical protein
LGRQRAEATALPNWVKPQLTKLVDQPPDGPEWLHEIKFDGYRLHARLDHGAVTLLTRTGLDWTHKYPAIAKAVTALDARQPQRRPSRSWPRRHHPRARGSTPFRPVRPVPRAAFR